MEILVNYLVIAGAGMLLLALFPVKHLHRDLSEGLCRSAWMFLSVLIFFFFLGYLLYAYLFWGQAHHWLDIVVPAIFFFGAVFVLVVCMLSAKTADGLCRLEHENVTDPLMGIYNRRHMDRCLRQEALNCRRCGLPLSVMLVDVDHFKEINDTYGHAIGDQVLQVLARLVKNCVRDFDLVFRYGGEELLVLLPNTGSEDAKIIADRLCRKVSERCLLKNIGDSKPLNVCATISIGVSSFCHESDDDRKMVARADMALYRAKEQGRNRVVFAPGPCEDDGEMSVVGVGE